MVQTEHANDERIEAVSNASGAENDLLTLAIPAGRALGQTLERIEERHADAEYLHADETSQARREVLERVRRILHGYEETPEHGLVIYVGVIEDELVEYVFDDLPAPVQDERIEWSNTFDLEPLETATDPSNTYGLLVVERGGAALGRLEAGGVEAIETIESDVMGKTRAGGQSAQRFERERQRQKHEFFEEVADEAERAFDDIDGLLLGGTTVTVDDFRDGEYLDPRLRDLTIGGVFSVEYASEQGLRQLAERARGTVEEAGSQRARDALDRFFEGLHDGGEVVYGRSDTEEALEYDAVDTLLVSDAVPVEERSELEARVEDEGGTCIVVPTDLEQGTRFHEAFGGVGGLLRFPIE